MSNVKDDKREDVIVPEARRKNKTFNIPRKKGIPVPKDCTFQDLSTNQRSDIMDNRLIGWKKEYNKRKGTLRPSSFEINRG